jgi:hypothetical protein
MAVACSCHVAAVQAARQEHGSFPLVLSRNYLRRTVATVRLQLCGCRRRGTQELLWCSEGFVNKTDDYSNDSPLDKVSRSLSQSKFHPDVQVHVVVQHKSTNYENADENAEARTFRHAGSAAMDHCENNGDNQDRYETCDESNRHNLKHFFFTPEYGRVLVAFSIRAGTSAINKKPTAKDATVPPSAASTRRK